MLSPRIATLLVVLLWAVPVSPQEAGTRQVSGGVEIYFQAVAQSEQCAAIADLPDALQWWRDEQGSVLTAALYLSASTGFRVQDGFCEFSVRIPDENDPAAFFSTWAQKCESEGGATGAETVAFCLSDRLRHLLRLYFERTSPSRDPGPLSPRPEAPPGRGPPR